MASQTSHKFMGPAQEQFECIHEQAIYFLDEFWPNWRNYEQPESYIIPICFDFKHPEVSDHVVVELRKKEIEKQKNPPAVLTDRIGDQAEYLAYNALEQIIHDRIQAPLVAIHNLNLFLNVHENKLRGQLIDILPHVDWSGFHERLNAQNAEFDFLLIGANVGVIAIEVKGSYFTKKTHFEHGSKALPDDYVKAIGQLERVHAVVYLLKCVKDTSGDHRIAQCTHKILFTPNLERKRYEEWLNSLTLAHRENVREKITGVVQWFKEDLENCDLDKPLLYSTIRRFLENTPRDMPAQMYEAYAPTLAAMRSIRILQSKLEIELDRTNFLEPEHSQAQYTPFIYQNPLSFNHHTNKPSPASALVKANIRIKNAQRIIFLTPDQQKAYGNKSTRHIIIGAAGTGKTVVLQAKAIELLEKGEWVTVLAPWNYAFKYKELFDSRQFENYSILDWSSEIFALIGQYLDAPLDKALELCSDISSVDDIYKIIDDCVNAEPGDWAYEFQQKFTRMLCSCEGHLIVDDAFDHIRKSTQFQLTYIIPILLVALAKSIRPSKIVWLGFDLYSAYAIDYFTLFINGHISQALRDFSIVQRSDTPCAVTLLRQVMRCSESVFNMAYKSVLDVEPEFTPSIGHKIRGLWCERIDDHRQYRHQAIPALCQRIITEITRLIGHGYSMNLMAIVIGSGDGDKIRTEFKNLCRQHWPDFDDQPFRIINQSGDKASLTCETEINVRQDLFAIHDWNQVSSFEWQVVLHAQCVLSARYADKNGMADAGFEKYRTFSRATTKLIEITMTYDRDLWDAITSIIV